MSLFILILLSGLFVVTHIGMSSDPYRKRMVDKLGEWGFKIVYSLVSFATLGGAIVIYAGHKSLGPVLWKTSVWAYPLVYLIMLIGFLLFFLSLVTPSPTGMMPAKSEARGVLRITRHPMNMGFACFGLAHLLANAALGDIFFFGSIFVTGFAGAYHQDRRKAQERGDDFQLFQSQTSILPFAALVQGKTRLDAGEFSKPLLIAAMAAYVAAILLHKKLFGISPF